MSPKCPEIILVQRDSVFSFIRGSFDVILISNSIEGDYNFNILSIDNLNKIIIKKT